MAELNLALLKKHVRADDFTEDDSYLEHLLETAKEAVIKATNRTEKELKGEGSELPNMLKQANRAIAAAYTEKSGMSEKDALDLMDAETWITAQDAVDYGLIDKIAGSQNSIQDEDAFVRLAASVGGMLPPSVINKMQKRKQALLDYFSE